MIPKYVTLCMPTKGRAAYASGTYLNMCVTYVLAYFEYVKTYFTFCGHT